MTQLSSKQSDKPSLLLIFLRFFSFALLLTPLVYWDELDFFFNSTKAFFLMGASELLLVGYAWLLWKEPQFRPRMNRVSVAFLLLLLALTLSTVFGVDPFTSFWGTSARADGLIMWLHLGAIFFVLASLFQTQEDWNEFFFAACVVGFIVSVLFYLHRLFPSFLIDSKDGSTTGNSTYLGVYLLFCVFFGINLFQTARTKWMSRFGIGSAVVFALTILLTSALAAKGALLGWIVFYGAIFAIASKRPILKKIGWTGVAVLIILFTTSTILLLRPGSFVRERFLEVSSGGRFAVWDVAWDAFLERPVFGWGIENFPIAFFSHYNPCFGAGDCGHEAWYDRAHTKILDTLVDGGIILFAAYLWLLLASILRVFKTRKTGILFFTFIVAFFVHNLVEFDIVITLLFSTILFAYAGSGEWPWTSPVKHRLSYAVFAIIATLLFVPAFYHSVIFPWSTNQMFKVKGARVMSERLVSYENMMNGSPIGIAFRRIQLAGETALLYYGMSDDARLKFIQPLRKELDIGIAALEESYAREPKNLRVSNLLGLLYQIKSQDSDPVVLVKAEDVLRRSIIFNRTNQQAYWPLAAVLIQKGDIKEARELLDQAIDLYPSHPDALIKPLVASKLTNSHDVFLVDVSAWVAKHPDLEPRTKMLLDIGDHKPDWLYTMFY